ncbi:unnamed protein product [Prorocentrum cordatum]|uniref:Uncharacterized protein n=1 Tax=Prorocentrum cordatum TaxID=2364126 RepID=A0ABN9PBF6_9DINO|nr:unnamed protein product [Polarella glacialis]
MWRQTGGCDGTGGPREPEKDQLCSFEVPAGASGFCDCDGDGLKGRSEIQFRLQHVVYVING